jgi:hypothetical protein
MTTLQEAIKLAERRTSGPNEYLTEDEVDDVCRALLSLHAAEQRVNQIADLLGICHNSQPVISSAPGVPERDGQFYVRCQTCSCHTQWAVGKDAARAAWNSRPESAIEAAAREAAKAWERWLRSGDHEADDLAGLYDTHYATMQALAALFKEPHRDA